MRNQKNKTHEKSAVNAFESNENAVYLQNMLSQNRNTT